MNRIPADQFQRYKTTVEIINRIRRNNETYTILEVGANEHRNLEGFLPSDKITYLDIHVPEHLQNDPSYIQGDATAMSLLDNQYDFVIALDVFEHIFPEKRNNFLSELYRVSRLGFIIGAPFDTPGVKDAEVRVNEFFKALYGYNHPWLEEHIDNGLPNLENTIHFLESKDIAFVNFAHGSLYIWEKLMRMHFIEVGSPTVQSYKTAIDYFYNTELYQEDYSQPCYRNFFIAFKQQEIRAQLEDEVKFSEFSLSYKENVEKFKDLEGSFYSLSYTTGSRDLNRETPKDSSINEWNMQLYMGIEQGGYTEENSIVIPLEVDKGYTSYNIELTSQATENIRLDLVNQLAYVEIADITLYRNKKAFDNGQAPLVIWDSGNQFSQLVPHSGIFTLGIDKVFSFVSIDNDPQLILKGVTTEENDTLFLCIKMSVSSGFIEKITDNIRGIQDKASTLENSYHILENEANLLRRKINENDEALEKSQGEFLVLLENYSNTERHLKNVIGNLEEEKNKILNSTSWRLTAPMRSLINKGRKVKRSVMGTVNILLRRSHKLRLNPVCDLKKAPEKGDDFWKSTGQDPYFILEGKWPKEWTEISWVASSDSLLNMRLYLDYGSGFNEQNVIDLGVIDNIKGKINRSIVHIHPYTRQIRLDVGDSPTFFQLSDVRFTYIGKMEILFRSFLKYWRQHNFSIKSFLLLLKKAVAFQKNKGIEAVWNRAKNEVSIGDNSSTFNAVTYDLWLKNHLLAEADKQRALSIIEQLDYLPLFSVIVPVYNVEEKWLRRCIESVQVQLYPHWELCIADDASSKLHIRKVLEEYAEKDNRIKVVFREKNGHISAASNSALELATGDFIALLDHDDELAPDALYENALLLNKFPEADMIYSDEDKISENGERHSPFFKPDWSPDLLLSQMYICHLGVYRTDLVRRLGGFRIGFEGSQDYDLILRVVEQTRNIFHISKILYHWRTIAESTAFSADSKGYTHQAGLKAIEEALERRGENAVVETVNNHAGRYRVRYLPQGEPLISIIIPTRDKAEILAPCLTSIFEKTNYKNYEVIIIDNGSVESQTFDLFKSWESREPDRFQILRLEIPFNYSRLNNKAVEVAKGELILLLNNDVEVITPNWLQDMAGQAMRPSIGAVGAKLFYPDDTIQHAGVVLGIGGVAGHSHKYFDRNAPGYFDRLIINSNYAAVTAACLMVRKEKFELVGGLNEELEVAFNDVDFCLKLHEKGFYNILLPDVQLYHFESKSRGHEDTPEKVERFGREIKKMQERWSSILNQDPFYNPNFTLEKEDFSLKV